MGFSGPGRRRVLSAALPALVVVITAAFWLARGDFSSLPEYGELPDFSLVDARGRAVTRQDLRGKVWVADLIYTRCVDTCPLQTAEMARLQKEFASAKDFLLVSITTDPKYDTPSVLLRYAASFRANPTRWYFLTGEEKAIERLVREGFRLAFAVQSARRGPRLKILHPLSVRMMEALSPPRAHAHHGEHPRGEAEKKGEAPRILIVHSSRFALVDRESRVRGYYLSDDAKPLKRLRRDVRTLLGR